MWTIVIENEDHKALSEYIDFNSSYLSSGKGVEDFNVLKYLDPWGDTTFNRLQFNDLIEDLLNLSNIESNNKDVIERIIKLISKCKETNHGYIKFYGD